MTKSIYTSVFILIWHLQTTGAFPGNRTLWNVPCTVDLGYLNGDICCLNCPAGTRMTSPCTRRGEKGKCEECNDGTYIEHGNGLKHCFRCTLCHSDQEIARPCTHTQDTECQCKPGRFCAPDQACEVCRKCSRCEKDEEIVRNCTSTANTQCKKIQPNAVPASDLISTPQVHNMTLYVSEPATPKRIQTNTSVIVPLVLLATVIIAVMIFIIWKRPRATDFLRNLPGMLKAGQCCRDDCPADESSSRETQKPGCSNLILSRQLVRAKPSAGMEDERKVLYESLSSSASNSQHSLTGLPSSAFPAPNPRASPTLPRQPDRRDMCVFPKLVPAKGEESLRKCFEYFEEIDFNHHKRFFRHLGIGDNVIMSKDHLLYEDRIHDLLAVWMEREGREANLNDLLEALLDLNQRRTAETVKDKAVRNGHYFEY